MDNSPKYSIGGYPEIARLPIWPFNQKKAYLTRKEADLLLSGPAGIEEKMDGRIARFETGRFVVFAEDLKIRHSISYRVPARFLLIDVFDKERGVMLGRGDKEDIYRDIRIFPSFFNGVVSDSLAEPTPASFFLPKLIASGSFSLEDIPNMIGYTPCGAKSGTLMEGVVVKLLAEEFPFMLRAAKLVRSEFTSGITRNYLRLKRKLNIIDPSVLEAMNLDLDAPRVPLILAVQPQFQQ